MRLAIIDLGTNSVRFDVHELGPDNQVFRLHREKLMIRLGEGVFLKHRLDQKAIRICIEAFRSFQQTIRDFRVHRIVAFGTSALREAKDSDRLIKLIEKECGIRVKIITGEEEARLIARGVLENESPVRGQFALVDIGGGSTEVSVCFGRRIINSASFPLGTARLQQIFLKTTPPSQVGVDGKSPPPIESLRRNIRGILLYKLVSEDWRKVRRIIGSSGTIRAIAKILKRRLGQEVFTRRALDELVSEMKTMNRAALAKIPGMEIRRVDMILSGAILLQECMSALHATEVSTTEFSLRDGILDEEIENLEEQKKNFSYDPIKDLYDTALDLGANEAELKQSLKTADQLFEILKPIHRMNESWKRYLLSASLLYNCGRSISPIDSEFHAAYIARYADVPAFEDWESKMIAELCFHAKNGKLEKSDLPFKKNRKLQPPFLKLLSILRLSAAFSFQRTQSVLIEKVRVQGKRIVIGVSARNHPDLAILRADQKRFLFEEVFRKQLVLEKFVSNR